MSSVTLSFAPDRSMVRQYRPIDLPDVVSMIDYAEDLKGYSPEEIVVGWNKVQPYLYIYFPTWLSGQSQPVFLKGQYLIPRSGFTRKHVVSLVYKMGINYDRWLVKNFPEAFRRGVPTEEMLRKGMGGIGEYYLSSRDLHLYNERELVVTLRRAS